MTEAAKHGAQPLDWVPCNLERALANDTEEIDANISATLASTYTPFNHLIEAHSGAISIVGSGPSLKKTWRRLRGDVMACNSAGKFLLENGIVPRYWMMFDADGLLAPSIVPRRDITYLVASRCHRTIFDKLKDCKVVVWHAKGDLHLDALLDKATSERRYQVDGKWYVKVEPMCGGGSTSVTRSMFLTVAMGYRELHLYGVDSSFPDGHSPHLEKAADEHQQKYMKIRTGPRNPREFNTTTWMVGQAEDFKVLSASLRNLGVKIAVHGEGLIPYLAGELGFDVDGQSKVKQIWREILGKTRLLWNV